MDRAIGTLTCVISNVFKTLYIRSDKGSAMQKDSAVDNLGFLRGVVLRNFIFLSLKEVLIKT